MLKIAKILSVVFHPIFCPIISIFILFHLPVYINYKLTSAYFNYVYGITILNLIIAPILISFYLKRKRIIKSLEMSDVRDRLIPYLASSLFYIFTYFLLAKINFPDLYLAIFKAACSVVIILTLLSVFKLKVSAHLAGLGGICGLLYVVSITLKVDITSYLLIGIILSGLVGSSRVFLKAHSLGEVFSGFVIGFMLQLIFLV